MSCMLTGKSQKSTHHLFFLRHVMMLRKRYIRSCKDLRNNLVQVGSSFMKFCVKLQQISSAQFWGN